MLTKISLNNFKSISTAEPISLKNFTIFCGANSSGKSSLIQALLMLSQTFSSRYDFDEVVLNGHLTRLGAFGDIKSHTALDKSITINFTIETVKLRRDGRQSIIDYKFIFGPRAGSTFDLEEDYHPVVQHVEIRTTEIDKDVGTSQYFKVSRRNIVEQNDSDLMLGSTFHVNHLESPEVEIILRDYPDFKVLGCESIAFVPYFLNIEYNHTKKIGPQIVALITGNVSAHTKIYSDKSPEADLLIPQTFFDVLTVSIENDKREYANSEIPKEFSDFLSQAAKESNKSPAILWRELITSAYPLSIEKLDLRLLPKPVRIREWLHYLNGLEDGVKKALTELMDKRRSDLQDAWNAGTSPVLRKTTVPLHHFQSISNYLSSYFSRSVKYLGPLRNEPQAVYASVGLSDPKNVGLKGEFTAAVLHINRFKRIYYPSPLDSENGKFSCVEKNEKFDVACKEWLAYLGVISDYQTKDKGKLGYEINVKIDEGDRWQDLTHVGVGVSQVLPIVLMFLLSEPGDLLIFEQPELHLHPKIQSRLCDFFSAMSGFGRQCLIETHSEYLINRLRLRIAQSRNSTIEENSSIFFITKTDSDSKFDFVKVNKFGAILEWPKDFFDQTDREVENILIEANKKMRLEKKENK